MPGYTRSRYVSAEAKEILGIESEVITFLNGVDLEYICLAQAKDILTSEIFANEPLDTQPFQIAAASPNFDFDFGIDIDYSIEIDFELRKSR